MNREYYRICFNIIPEGCRPITFTVAISEPFEQFVKRNKTKYRTIQVMLICSCSKEEYQLYKRFNPTDDGCYAKLLKEDYRKI
jgi:hypothetical protein